MAKGTYISIITLNVNGLNVETKRHRLAEWIKKKTHIYVVYKETTSDLKTHIDWNWEDRKIYSMQFSSVQFSSFTQSCLTLWDPINHSIPGLPVHHQLPEFTQTHVHRVSDAIQPSHPLSSPSPALNLSKHQGLFKWVSSSHHMAKVLEFQLQHQSFQWTLRTDLL